MRQRRRPIASALGMSFLDLLCSGIGSVVLLLVLMGNAKKTDLIEMEDVLQTHVNATQMLIGEVSAVQSRSEEMRRYAATLRNSPRIDGLTDAECRQLTPHTVSRNLVVVLDLSGSMNWYYPPKDPEFVNVSKRLKEKGRKWDQALEVIGKLLLQSASLERFVVLGLTVGDANGRPIVKPEKGLWFQGDKKHALHDLALDVLSKLRKIEPSGGSRHLEAIESAFRYVSDGSSSNSAADTIILITDGLPNHGPARPEPPSGALVSYDDRRTHAEDVTKRIKSFFAELSQRDPDHLIRLHVICLHWPDDPDLAFYGIEWAAAGKGTMLYLPPGL